MFECLRVPHDRWSEGPFLYNAAWVREHAPADKLHKRVIRDVRLTVNNAAGAGREVITTVLMAFRQQSSEGHQLEQWEVMTPPTDPGLPPPNNNFVEVAHSSPWTAWEHTMHTWTFKIPTRLRLPTRGRWKIVAWVFHQPQQYARDNIGDEVQQCRPLDFFFLGGPRLARVEQTIDVD